MKRNVKRKMKIRLRTDKWNGWIDKSLGYWNIENLVQKAKNKLYDQASFCFINICAKIWSTGVNFINIIREAFLEKSVFEAFLYLQKFGFVIFWHKKILAQKLLVKCWWNWLQVRAFIVAILQRGCCAKKFQL